jgi:hypothetical protein
MAGCKEAWPQGLMPQRCGWSRATVNQYRTFIQRVKSSFSPGTSERESERIFATTGFLIQSAGSEMLEVFNRSGRVW